MTREELVERMAVALWNDWRANCESARDYYRDIDWEKLSRWAKASDVVAGIVRDAYKQANAALTAIEAHIPVARILSGELAVLDPVAVAVSGATPIYRREK